MILKGVAGGEGHLAQARISCTEHDAIPDEFTTSCRIEFRWNDTASLRFSQTRRFLLFQSKKRLSLLKTQAFQMNCAAQWTAYLRRFNLVINAV